MGIHAQLPIDDLPGADLVVEGIEDLRSGRDTAAAALVRMAAPRLRFVGLDVPQIEYGVRPGHRLYELLASADPATAHGRYNALVARVVSFARAAERARAARTASTSRGPKPSYRGERLQAGPGAAGPRPCSPRR